MKMKIVGVVFFIIILAFFFPHPPEKKNRSDALDALQFMAAQRAYPNNAVPDSAYYNSFMLNKLTFLKDDQSRTSSLQGQWQPMGPINVGGRTLAIAFNLQNPNTIYAGSASGGLWRSYSGGLGVSAWGRITTGYPVLGVSAIAVAPNDSNIILIGTGEVYGASTSLGGFSLRLTRGSYGIGILKSTDAGKTWTKSLDWSRNDQRGVQAIKFHPTNPALVWAATTHGVYKSVDAGKVWTKSLDVAMVTDLVLHPTDTSIVLVTCGNLSSAGNGFYKTTNGGSTWSKSLSGLPGTYSGKAVLWLHASPSPLIYASIGLTSESGTLLVRSKDFGTTWETISNFDYANYQAWYSHVVAVHPASPEIVFCGGIDLYRSIDSGRTLVQIGAGVVHVDIHCVAFHPTDPSIIYFGTDGGLVRGHNNGQVYLPLVNGYQTAQFYNGFSSSLIDSNYAMGGLQDNSTQVFIGSTYWVWAIGGDGGMTAIHPTNDNIIWGSTQYLNLFRSTDKGGSWTNISPATIDVSTTSFIGPYAVYGNDPTIMYAGTKIIYKSTNMGVSWIGTNASSPLDGNKSLAIAIAPNNPDVVYVSTAPTAARAGFFITTDGGQTWQNRTGALPDRYLIDVVVDPFNSAVVHVTASGYGSGHVFKSTDAGMNWVDITRTLPDVPTSALAADPMDAKNIYVGNDIGVYQSLDGGKTWNMWSDGLPEAVIVMDLSFSPLNHSLRVATHGNGAYERKLPPIVGASIAVSKAFIEFGKIDLGFSSDTVSVALRNQGSEQLTITSIITRTSNFAFSELPAFPVNIAPSSSILIKVYFKPSTKGPLKDTIFVASNDAANPNAKIILQGTGFFMKSAEAGVLYAAQGGGQLYTINTVNGEVSPIGPLDLPQLHGLAIQPSNNEIYGAVSTLNSTSLYRITTDFGAAAYTRSIPVKNLTAMAFNSDNILYGGTGTGKLYRINLSTSEVVLVGTATNLSYWALSFSPTSGKLWASARHDNDSIYIVNTSTGVAKSVGTIGLFAIPRSLAFNSTGVLYCLIDNGSGEDYLATLDTLTGAATLISENPLSVSNLSAIAMRSDVLNWVSQEQNVQLPKTFSLSQNYPNPFNPSTVISYQLPAVSQVTLKIYDILGREVSTLVNEEQSAGWKEVQWNADNISSGLYFYELKATREGNATYHEIRKMMFIK